MAWRNLWPYVMFGDVSSDEDDFEGFGAQAKKPVALILDIIRNAPSSSPVVNLQDDDVRKWLDMDLSTNVTHNVSNAKIAESILSSKQSLIEENCEDLTEENISWAKAAKHLQKFITFAQRNSSYSTQEVLQLHDIYSSFQKKRTEYPKKKDVENFLEFVSTCLRNTDNCQNSSGQEVYISSTLTATSLNSCQKSSDKGIDLSSTQIATPLNSKLCQKSVGQEAALFSTQTAISFDSEHCKKSSEQHAPSLDSEFSWKSLGQEAHVSSTPNTMSLDCQKSSDREVSSSTLTVTSICVKSEPKISIELSSDLSVHSVTSSSPLSSEPSLEN